MDKVHCTLSIGLDHVLLPKKAHFGLSNGSSFSKIVTDCAMNFLSLPFGQVLKCSYSNESFLWLETY